MAGVTNDPHAREFAELFPRIYARFCRRWAPGEYRPSAEAAAILEHLADAGPLTVTEAAAHFDRSQAATSELIARLERRGLVERMPDERDQRRHLVWLTKAGRATVADIRRVLDPARLAAAFARMSSNMRRELVAGMRALLWAADELKHHTKGKR
jgi:DNA-binding MarR family transcriptional regulator